MPAKAVGPPARALRAGRTSLTDPAAGTADAAPPGMQPNVRKHSALGDDVDDGLYSEVLTNDILHVQRRLAAAASDSASRASPIARRAAAADYTEAELLSFRQLLPPLQLKVRHAGPRAAHARTAAPPRARPRSSSCTRSFATG